MWVFFSQALVIQLLAFASPEITLLKLLQWFVGKFCVCTFW